MTVDTLGYTKRLVAAGIKREHAEAHAEAMRDFIAAKEPATRSDLKAAIDACTLRLTTWFVVMSIALTVAIAVVAKLP